MLYDALVAGAGFTGSVVARKLAEAGKKVLLLEKRPHIAGNMYDEFESESGILTQRYGPHTFATDHSELVDYIRRFSSWHPYYVEIMANIDDMLLQSPFGIDALPKLFSPEKAERLLIKLKTTFPDKERTSVYSFIESPDKDIRDLGELLFEKDYRPYTQKIWGLPPESIDRSVLDRVQFRLTGNMSYMAQRYQLMPDQGYTSFFTNLLDHKLIDIETGCDATEYLTFNDAKLCVDSRFIKPGSPVVFTGPIDELLDGRCGSLAYRSLLFNYEILKKERSQDCAIYVYPKAPGRIRSVEYKLLTGQLAPGRTLIASETPGAYVPGSSDFGIPYYPVLNADNRMVFTRYRHIADAYTNLYVCGRLGDYRYYNMDDAILCGFRIANQISLILT